MEEEIIEINLSGFCRTCNSMQTVTCEYIPTESGRKLDVMNCAHKTCRHHAACAIYRESHENELSYLLAFSIFPLLCFFQNPVIGSCCHCIDHAIDCCKYNHCYCRTYKKQPGI